MPDATKEQHCDYCGESLGVFVHSRRFDGPLVCGAAACNRDARDDERAQIDAAREDAEADGYSLYGGPGGRW